MTRQEIRTLARKTLGETTAAFWTDDQLNNWIDDAGYDIAYLTRCIRANKDITLTGGTGEYTISTAIATNIVSLIDIWYKVSGATWAKLDLMAREELDTRYPNWRSASSGTPTIAYFDTEEDIVGFYVPPAVITYTNTTIAFVDSNPDTLIDTSSQFLTEGFLAGQTITLSGSTSNDGTYTIESAAAGTLTLAESLTAEVAGDQVVITVNLSAKIFYSKYFTDLTAEGSVPGIPTFLHKTMAIFVVARGFESRGWGDKANDQWQKYSGNIEAYRRERMIDKDHRESSEVLFGKGISYKPPVQGRDIQ